jgi:DNA-binding NarL/FixJ family response regulator
MEKIRVILVDDQLVGIEALQYRLSNASEVEIIAVAKNKNECISLIRSTEADVILMDFIFQGEDYDGADLTELILNIKPNLKVIIISQHYNFSDIHKAILLGATGFVSKEIDRNSLINEILSANKGVNCIDTKTLEQVFAYLKNIPLIKRFQPAESLTPRERDLVEVIVEYKKFERVPIGEKLFVGTEAVGRLVQNVSLKWDIKGHNLVRQIYDIAIQNPHLWKRK